MARPRVGLLACTHPIPHPVIPTLSSPQACDLFQQLLCLHITNGADAYRLFVP